MKYLALIICIVGMTGCSSTSGVKVVDQTQYCHTTSNYVLKNGNVSSSETLVECSDKPNPRATFDKGMDGTSCGWAEQWYTLRNKLTKTYTMACQLQDGSWTYVPNVIAQ